MRSLKAFSLVVAFCLCLPLSFSQESANWEAVVALLDKVAVKQPEEATALGEALLSTLDWYDREISVRDSRILELEKNLTSAHDQTQLYFQAYKKVETRLVLSLIGNGLLLGAAVGTAVWALTR